MHHASESNLSCLHGVVEIKTHLENSSTHAKSSHRSIEQEASHSEKTLTHEKRLLTSTFHFLAGSRTSSTESFHASSALIHLRSEHGHTVQRHNDIDTLRSSKRTEACHYLLKSLPT